MDLTEIPLIAAITRKMGWLSDRQKVLADDVANNDTPHFHTKDLQKLDFGRELAAVATTSGLGGGFPSASPLALATTTPGQIAGDNGADGEAARQVVAVDDRSINGNTASLEDELMKVSANAADYQLMTELYQKQVGMFTTALDRGGA